MEDLRTQCLRAVYSCTSPAGILVALLFRQLPEQNSRLPPVLSDDNFESPKFSLVFLLRSVCTPEEHRPILFFSVKEVLLSREVTWVRGAHHYDKECIVEGRYGTSIWGMAASSMYQHGVGGAFFAERDAKTAHREYAILTGLGTFAQAP